MKFRRAQSKTRFSILRPLEQLESRDVPADLYGYSFGATPAAVNAGDNVTAAWSVANGDFDTISVPFNVGFYLSKDSVIDVNDRYLGTVTLPGGFPGFFVLPTQQNVATLPVASDAFWQGTGTYYLGMRVDDQNNVFESNELNNSNLG